MPHTAFSAPSAPWFLAEQIRHANATELAQALAASRARTLALFAAFRSALGGKLHVPLRPELNPPLWELGHIGWFAEFWLARNPERHLGTAAHPDAPRAPSLLGQTGGCLDADALFNSSTVTHATRWQLPLPDVDTTLAYLQGTLAQTCALLARAETSDAALYFFRLALLHEDMHGEAWVQMAQTLGIAPGASAAIPALRACTSAAHPAPEIELPARTWQLGGSDGNGNASAASTGFAFDNELHAHSVALPAFGIDARPVCLAQFLAFVEDGGYQQAHWWSAQGRQWLADSVGQNPPAPQHPPHLRRSASGWQQQRFGQWLAADLAAPALHINYFEAQAWCRWAGRRLPSEAEWECAAISQPGLFEWGHVWEWTASAFAPYPGFAPHPYRDYSAPWFGTHQVLRGASQATHERIKHPRYRNFFVPSRSDVRAGFRSCRAEGLSPMHGPA